MSFLRRALEKTKKLKGEILYFISNAPLAIIASAFPGFANYAVILFLSAFYTMEDVGQYRLLFSYFAIFALLSWQESSKLNVRSVVADDRESSTALVILRGYGVLISTLVVALIALVGVISHKEILPAGLLPVAVIACFIYPADLFVSYLQAQRRFSLLAGLTIIKYSASLLAFAAGMYATTSILIAVLAQLGVMALSNLYFFHRYSWPTLIPARAGSLMNPKRLAKMPAVRESTTLSLANWLPSVLEHVDKMVIGYLFGLEVLGVYTLAFSTGRFVYNALKPAFYIYYRHFVSALPPRRILVAVLAAFTLFGMVLSGAFALGLHYVPFFEKFHGAEAVVFILFLSYGIGMVDAVYSQSYGINKEANSKHLLVANTAISLLCLGLFASCAFLSAGTAFIVCALHYPIRHAGTVLLLSLLRKRATATPHL